MTAQNLDPRLCTVKELFTVDDPRYTIPIYQRNFAWGAEQIEQLISDVKDAFDQHADGYFLGNLIVTRRTEHPVDYEVIDGQQRLTTLYLLLSFLTTTEMETIHHDKLTFESRPQSVEALRRIASATYRHGRNGDESPSNETAIYEGFNVVQQYMDQHVAGEAPRRELAHFLRDKVTVVRATLPDDTDFNRYFEIMNTRGQQLQQVDIVKARLMSRLETDDERSCFAWIWDACADMDSYVNVSLARGNTNLRTRVFGHRWSWLSVASFEELARERSVDGWDGAKGVSSAAAPSAALTIDGALRSYASRAHVEDSEEVDNVRFRSTIEFSAFLLHVLNVFTLNTLEKEGNLDDKQLIRRFDSALSGGESDRIRLFAFELLRCRVLFDSFILKRQYTATNSDDGDWSLQRVVRRVSKSKALPGYINTFSVVRSDDTDDEVGMDTSTRDVLLLESMLRVTFTSPRTMHWMTKLLHVLSEAEPHQVTDAKVAQVLRDYARDKVRDFMDAKEIPSGFAVPRIVFTYLDYLLLQNPIGVVGSMAGEFRFSFRNSIEHFYPQQADREQSGARVSNEYLNMLGNLALVSVSANSKFSNSLPLVKAGNFPIIMLQSPKLAVMADLANRANGWADAEVRAHHNAMLNLLRTDLRQNRKEQAPVTTQQNDMQEGSHFLLP